MRAQYDMSKSNERALFLLQGVQVHNYMVTMSNILIEIEHIHIK